MTDPSRTTPAASDQASADSQGPLDPTQSRPPGAAEPDFAAPAHAGEVGRLGRYRVLQKLGAGGMGAVYLGFDAALDRKVALKVMLPQFATDRDARERFLREARAAAKVHSDHVVTIHDVGEERGIPFIAMEYLLGLPLDRFLKQKGDLHLTQALRVVRETAAGLSAAHALGLVHRDIKPANLWLEAPKGRVKILDFGLARPANDDAHLTGSGAVMGTPAYMSPEQGRGLKVDHRTDLFSLGVVLYRLTTGKMPFTGAGAMAVLTSLAVDTPVAPRQLNPELPEAVEAVINKLLAKNPAERFQTAKEVIAALSEIENPRSGSGQLPVVVATPVQPLSVSVQTQNVWEGIDAASESVPVPLATSVEAPADAPAEPTTQRKVRGAPKWPLFAALAAVLAAGVVVGVVVMSLPKKPEAVQTEDPPPSDKPRPPVTPPKKDDKQVTPEPAGKVYPLPPDLIAPMTPVKPKEVFSLDFLNPAKHIPPEEKYDWQPKELIAVLGSHRQRLVEPANWLQLSPDGKTVLAGADGPRWAIDVATGRLRDWPALAAFSPDGKRAARGNKIWELGELKKPSTDYALPGDIVEFLTEDTVLVAGEGKYVAWKLTPEGAKPLGNFPDPFSFAVSSDRKYLAIAGNDQSCRVFDITPDGPKERFALPGPEGKVFTAGVPSSRLSFSDTGLLATVDPSGSVRVWDVTAPAARLLHTIDEKGPAAVALFPKGDRVIRGTDSGFAVWSLEGEKPKKLASAHGAGPGGELRSIAVALNGTLVTGHSEGAVRFWGIEKGTIFERNPLKPQPIVDPQHADLSPDGRFAALRHEDGKTHIWNLDDLTSRPVANSSNDVFRFAPVVPTAWARRTSDAGGVPRLVHLSDLSEKAFPSMGGFNPACFSPDGNSLAGVSGAELAIWDVTVSPPKERWRVPLGRGADFWRFTPDGRFLVGYTRPNGGFIKVWAMTQRGPVPRFETTHSGILYHLALSPDGKTVFTCSDSGFSGYSLNDGVLELRQKNQLFAAAWADFSPDGRSLLVGGGNAWLKLLDVASGKVLHEWSLRGASNGGRFHPDGKHVFVTNADRTTYILRLPKEVLERLNDPDRKAAEYVLGIGGIVRVNGGEKDIKDAKDLPKERFSLTRVALDGNKQVTDTGLAAFEGCTSLTALSLEYAAQVTDAGLAHFKNCKGLTVLHLNETQVTDAGLAHFKDCKGLGSLHLGFAQIGDTGLAHFKDCKNLTQLALFYTRVTDRGLAYFKDCKNLTVFSVNETQVTDAGLAHFKGLTDLTYLGLAAAQVTDEGLANFKDCKALKHLVVSGSRATDAGLANFKECASLSHFTARNTAVTDAGLATLAGCKNLRIVEVEKTKITEKGVTELAKALPQCKVVWDGGIIAPKK